MKKRVIVLLLMLLFVAACGPTKVSATLAKTTPGEASGSQKEPLKPDNTIPPCVPPIQLEDLYTDGPITTNWILWSGEPTRYTTGDGMVEYTFSIEHGNMAILVNQATEGETLHGYVFAEEDYSGVASAYLLESGTQAWGPILFYACLDNSTYIGTYIDDHLKDRNFPRPTP